MDPIDAKAKLEIVRARVIAKYPFWQYYLANIKFVWRGIIPSLSLGRNLWIYFNHDYVGRKSVRELSGLLICMLYQIFLSQGRRRSGRDPFVWMLSCGLESGGDFSDGTDIGLPSEAVVPLFYNLQKGLTAEEYYSILVNMDEIPLPFCLRNESGEEIHADYKFTYNPKQQESAAIIPGENLVQEDIDQIFDIFQLEQWEDNRPKESFEFDPIFEMILKEDTKKGIIRYEESYPGRIPDFLLLEAQAGQSQIQWKSKVRRLIKSLSIGRSGRAQFDFSYINPNEDMMDNNLMFPGFQTVGAEILILLDTSGSMRAEYFKFALGETSGLLKQLCGPKGIKVAPCDAVIKPLQNIRSVSQLKLIGGGGTDMSNGLKAVTKIKPKPDLVVVMTDGETEWPKNPIKDFPILVLIVSRNWSTKTYKEYPVPNWMNLIEMFPRSKKRIK